jgi:hypothetical protein
MKVTLKRAGNPTTAKAIDWIMQRISVTEDEARELLPT